MSSARNPRNQTMSDNDAPEEGEAKKPGMMGKLIVWGVVFVMGAGAGAAVPLLTGGTPDEAAAFEDPFVEKMDIPEPDDEFAYIDYDDVTANLKDPRASRYVNVTVALKVAKSQEAAITKLVEDNDAILKNWLLSHLRDKKLEEVAGKFGHNMLRREIHGEFNKLLFTDGIERIQDVLLKDFKIQ